MIILALDTSYELASVALRRDGVTAAEEGMSSAEGHAHAIFSLIEVVLERAGVRVGDVDCFASSVGPGSFTGIRVCLTAAKGLAEATGKRMCGVSNLRAMAVFGTAALRNPVLDARRGQIYTAVYDSELRVVAPEVLTTEREWSVSPEIERISERRALAEAIAICGERDGVEKWVDPALVDANYVRESDAEMAWRDLRGQGG